VAEDYDEEGLEPEVWHGCGRAEDGEDLGGDLHARARRDGEDADKRDVLEVMAMARSSARLAGRAWWGEALTRLTMEAEQSLATRAENKGAVLGRG
jgi:hypothetical protein